MELNQLRYFVSIAETLSFTRSAQMLHVSQPALSYQMRQLEMELGTRLFDRERRKIALTPSGEIFLPLAQAVLFRADEAVRVLREHMGMEAGEVRMGCNPSVATYVVPGLIATFRASFPRVLVHLVEGGDVELIRGVLEGSVDFAVVTAPGSPQSLDAIPLPSEDMLVAVAPNHRFASRRSVALAELAYESFVFGSESFNVTLQSIDACRRAGFEPKVAYRTGSLESVKNFVRQGLGVSILPRMALGGSNGEGLALIETEDGLTRSFNLIRGKDRSTTGAARALMLHVRTAWEEQAS
jgi:LysR family transcriptional regulator, transcription activator of glutamate synthase operon